MLRGLEGRRVALFARGDDAAIRGGLERAGAEVVDLATGTRSDPDWHAGKYAALVLGTCIQDGSVNPRALQLLREFLVADKPVAVFGEGLQALEQAGAIRDDVVLAEASSGGDFPTRLVAELSNRLDDAQVDDMSEQSFPASDPPSVTPTSAGPGSEPRP